MKSHTKSEHIYITKNVIPKTEKLKYPYRKILLFQLKNNFLKNGESKELENHKEGFPFSFKNQLAQINVKKLNFSKCSRSLKTKKGEGSLLNKT